MKQFRLFKFVGAIVLPQIAGLVGSIFTAPAIETWYANLNQPSFQPPNWIFGPVWTLLYLLMGIALYFVWLQYHENRKARFAFWFFLAHLVANSLWSILFFGFQQIGLAFLCIVLLWIWILILEFLFARIDVRSAWLLIPYFLWVSFAGTLNLAIWALN